MTCPILRITTMSGGGSKLPQSKPIRAGFTLIELLVVLSIIALLVALLLPALGKAKSSATAATCNAAQRQIMMAVATYAVDNKDFMPMGNAIDPLDQTGLQNVNNRDSRIAGRGIWGIDIYAGLFAPGTAKLTAIGLGVLVTNSYLSLESLWCPADKKYWGADRYGSYDANTWTRRKLLFGNTVVTNPWLDDQGQPMNPWTQWNYGFEASYIWRSADRSYWDPTTNTLKANFAPGNQQLLNGSYLQPGTRVALRTFLRLSCDTNGARPMLIDSNKAELRFAGAVFHGDMGGANAGFGDGSSRFWRDTVLAKGFYTSAPSYFSQAPWTTTVTDPVAGDQWFSIWGSLACARADFYFRGDMRGK